ncbi:hypothetical protein [Bradyrhizobium liaoningense]|uniref:hypothetical protein n=1 Tax=Bradyrhizobium liaoningense TaxID=43992 RepID=UPI001BAB67F4|nr:hypothetical protein [Bradyrhizobium liaoningense]MBR1031492.1 hypothetical protein [Bradyrhizobium liaoningense]
MERTVVVVKRALYSDIKVRNRPSFYATAVAWAAADFTQLLIQDDGAIVAHRTGLIVASDECSLSTIRDISHTAAQGTISPLRFAGASPSIVAGLPALQQGIRGPTLSLTMPPEHASNAIVAMIDYWIQRGNIVAVIAIAHYKEDECRHLFKGLIARSVGDELRQHVRQLCDPHTGEK